jgi:hypothetical protein
MLKRPTLARLQATMSLRIWAAVAPHNGLELSCPAEAGKLSLILAHNDGPGAPPYGPARRVSFSELLDGSAAVSSIAVMKWPREPH